MLLLWCGTEPCRALPEIPDSSLPTSLHNTHSIPLRILWHRHRCHHSATLEDDLSPGVSERGGAGGRENLLLRLGRY